MHADNCYTLAASHDGIMIMLKTYYASWVIHHRRPLQIIARLHLKLRQWPHNAHIKKLLAFLAGWILLGILGSAAKFPISQKRLAILMRWSPLCEYVEKRAWQRPEKFTS